MTKIIRFCQVVLLNVPAMVTMERGRSIMLTFNVDINPMLNLLTSICH
jgi:hypothetical protein